MNALRTVRDIALAVAGYAVGLTVLVAVLMGCAPVTGSPTPPRRHPTLVCQSWGESQVCPIGPGLLGVDR